MARSYGSPMRTTGLTLVSALVLAAGCGPNTRGSGPPGAPTLMSIEVQPANATVAVDNGMSSPVAYSAVGHFSDGTTMPLADATFALDDKAALLGALTGAQFAATGATAGSGQVIASSQGMTGSTGVTVTVHALHVDPMAPPDAPGKFGTTPPPMGLASPTVDYPLDGAVMPATVKAPDVQWEGANTMGDLYRVRYSAGGASVENIVAVGANFTFDSTPSADDWALLLRSAGGQPIAVTVDIWDPTSGAQASAPVHVNVKDADVQGVIYYWDLTEGKMQRIDGSGRALAIPNPPANPQDATNHCVACHVVSKDGRYLASELWGGSQPGAVFDLSNPQVTTGMGGPAPTLAPVGSYVSLFSSFNPDASRLIINPGTALQLIDPKNGMTLNPMGTPLPTKAAHPSWSPDGTMIAFVNNIDGSWAVDYTTGDLSVIPVTGPDTFGAPKVLVQSSTGDPAYKAPSWPTFAPDSQWIAYAAGVNSRGRNTDPNTMQEVVYPGALFLVASAGGTPTKLDTACGGVLDCYLPNFSPYDSGGYYWLVFYSLRDYGNAQAGTKGTKRRQMWVTAIDKSKLGQGDPSSVPYWLPDQDPKTDNMSAFWAVPPPLQ